MTTNDLHSEILSATFPRLVPADRHKAGCIGEKFLDVIVEYGMPLKQVEPQCENLVGWACLTEAFVKDYSIPIETIRRESMKNLMASSRAASFAECVELLGFPAPDLQEPDPPYLILRIDGNEYGASAVMDLSLMLMAANTYKSDVYVIFSSLYEAMVMPVSMGWTPDEISVMHKSVQDAEVAENERLSDTVYLFRRDACTLEIVGGDPDDPDHIYQYE